MHINSTGSAIDELLTLRDLIRWGASHFSEANLYFGHGTDNAWDDAVALAFHSLHLTHDLYPQVIDTRLLKTERKALIDLFCKRIKTRLPTPYLTHEAWFAGLSFYVDERVLIPRSPMAEVIEKQFEPWLAEHEIERILDIGTGSGCIAIASAIAFPNALVDAVDNSEDALAVAKINVAQHGLQDRVRLIKSDLFAEIPDTTYDIIVSNPPYVSAAEMASLPQEYQHEPPAALASGEEGLDHVKKILARASLFLSEHGIVVVEVGDSASALQEAYPQVPFVWLEFERGGDGVFLLTRQQLVENF